MFETICPEAVNYKKFKFTATHLIIDIRRPNRFGNPFFIGMKPTLQSITTALGKVEYFDELVTLEFLKKYFPNIPLLIINGSSMSRNDVITSFRYLWKFSRNKNLITDEEVLTLKNAKLKCCCSPLTCHGDVIVDDFILTEARLRNSNEQQRLHGYNP